MIQKTEHDQHTVSFASKLLQENERVTFDLQSRTLILINADERITQVARLSQIDAHLLLPLVYFYPQYVPDSTFSLGYTVDLSTYYQYLRTEVNISKPQATYPVIDGIERLKKRLVPLGITVVRVRNIGYILERWNGHHSKGSIQGWNSAQTCK